MKDKLSFRESQIGAYHVLEKIDEICAQQQLTYFLMYGSLIGAVREGGIIPWDDDIDIMMPRPDYDKFIKYCADNQKETAPFEIFEHSLKKEYIHPIARMSDSRYILDFENEKDYGLGLFVDIYPLDGVGNDFNKAKKLINKSRRNASLCFLTSRKKFGRDNTSSSLKMVVKFPAYIWANILGNNYYIKKSEHFCRKYNYENSQFVSCVAQPFKEKKGENKNIYEKEMFKPIKVKFEGKEFFAPSGYDKILTMGYGDYMTPYSKEKRQTHHTYNAYKK